MCIHVLYGSGQCFVCLFVFVFCKFLFVVNYQKRAKKKKKNANTPTGRGDACRLADYLLTGIRTRLILNRNEGKRPKLYKRQLNWPPFSVNTVFNFDIFRTRQFISLKLLMASGISCLFYYKSNRA